MENPETQSDGDEKVAGGTGSTKLVSWWIVLVGVLLPAVTLGIETTTGICAESLFDPLPTIGHSLLVAWVPAVFLLLCFIESPNLTRLRPWLPTLVGSVLVVCAIYSAPFIPFLPLAVVGILAYGLGLLPLSPLLALIAGLAVALRLCRQMRFRRSVGRLVAGMVLALSLFIAVDRSAIITHVGLEMFSSCEPETQRSGIRLLRNWASDDDLRRACYQPDSRSVLLRFRQGVAPEAARRAYYRATGKLWNSEAPPENKRFLNIDRWVWDTDQGGRVVGQRLAGLSLSSSEMAGQIDPEGALGYLEWTLVLANASKVQAEARAEIALPPKGVVSRVTLWVNGEPREAAFGGREQVRNAYESIVRARRDPLLVTTSGDDRVLVQCFPVPPEGEMKIRLGVTFPLALTPGHGRTARLRFPTVIDRNFGLGEDVLHTVQLTSDGPWRLQRRGSRSDEISSEDSLELTDKELKDYETFAEFKRQQRPTVLWSKETPGRRASEGEGGDEYFVLARWQAPPQDPVSHLEVVIDGSAAMEPHHQELVDLLQRLDRLEAVSVVDLATDLEDLDPTPAGGAAAWLAKRRFVGGQDNVPALSRAFERLPERPGSAVLWITSPQPFELSTSPPDLETALDEGNRLFVLPVSAGSHELVRELERSPAVHHLARYGSLEQALNEIPGLTDTDVPASLSFQRLQGEPPAEAVATSPHLARLWAVGEVRQLLEMGDENSVDQALDLAVEYQLVTPVSGAVVLETQEQYEAASLEPVAASTVPTIPEPAMIALLAVVLLSLLIAQRGNLQAAWIRSRYRR